VRIRSRRLLRLIERERAEDDPDHGPRLGGSGLGLTTSVQQGEPDHADLGAEQEPVTMKTSRKRVGRVTGAWRTPLP